MNILLIEDEEQIARFIKKGLEESFHHATVICDGQLAYRMAVENNFDLVILDVLLKEWNGFEICRQIKACKPYLPVLMLTALGSVPDKVRGFETGADDYLTKPFHFAELLARINALDRRRKIPAVDSVYEISDLCVNCYKRLVTRDGKPIVLTIKEFTLLELLLCNKNRVLSRTYIAEAVWGINFNRGTNLIDVYINHLRSKVDKGFSPSLIHTVIGMGYIIKEGF